MICVSVIGGPEVKEILLRGTNGEGLNRAGKGRGGTPAGESKAPLGFKLEF